MRKINPNLLKLVEMTRNPDLKMPLERAAEEFVIPKLKEIPGYIYVPSIKLYVAERRSLLGKNWYDCHKELHKRRQRMLTLHEFVEFLKYLKGHHSDRNNWVFNDILEVKKTYRIEWIDAYFKVLDYKRYMDYRHETINGKLIPRYSIEMKGCLIEERSPGIDLEDWINNPTPLGLPRENIKEGNFYYYFPSFFTVSIAVVEASPLEAGLNCELLPYHNYDALGVRAARCR